MTDLRKGIRDYLMLRRGLGFQLVKHEARLEEFASFLERKGSARITSELAVSSTLGLAAIPVGPRSPVLLFRPGDPAVDGGRENSALL